jgi:hypothetical protein
MVHLPNNQYEPCLLDQLTQTPSQNSGASLLHHPMPAKEWYVGGCIDTAEAHNPLPVPSGATWPMRAEAPILTQLSTSLEMEPYSSDDNWHHICVVHWDCSLVLKIWTDNVWAFLLRNLISFITEGTIPFTDAAPGLLIVIKLNRVIKKSLSTWWLPYKKHAKMF